MVKHVVRGTVSARTVHAVGVAVERTGALPLQLPLPLYFAYAQRLESSRPQQLCVPCVSRENDEAPMRWRQFFRRKPLQALLAEMAGEHRLHRVLGPVSLTSLGVGAIIGAGIFAMTGRVAAEDAGPA